MAAPARRVERLHLKARSERSLRSVLPLLEDAFRTADLDDAGARLVFVRRLDLGRFAAGTSAQTLSLVVERRFARGDRRVVHGAHADAAGAAAVWFRDSLEAHEIAAVRLLSGGGTDAWFWPLAVPTLARAATLETHLRAMALTLANLDEGPAALPAWTGTLIEAGYGSVLADALPSAAAQVSWREVRARDSGTVSANARPQRHRPGELEGAGRDVTSARAQEHGGLSPVSTRTAAVDVAMCAALIPNGGAGSASRIAGLSPAGSDAPPATPGPSPSGDGALWVDANEARELRAKPAGHREAGSGTGAERHVHAALPADNEHQPRARRPAGHASTPDVEPGVRTAAGGLLFLVPVLARLQFPEWCAAQPAGQPPPHLLARDIFHLLLSRLDVDEGDPAWALARPAETDWSSDPPSAVTAQGNPARLWLSASRRLLRQQVRTGLSSLVLRRARLALTPTHADVFFGAGAGDLRVRRAGLDIDPGWVAWLRRVVSFHYCLPAARARDPHAGTQ